MKLIVLIALTLCFASCTTDRHEIVKLGEANFRITLNYNRELSDAELDSLENSKPSYSGTFRENEFYNLLVSKGIVSNQTLDTSGLLFALVTWDKPIANFGDMQLILDTAKGNDRIFVKGKDIVLNTDLGPRLLGDIFVSYLDIDHDRKYELLVMKKYYVMGGYNFDLKAFRLN